MAEKQIKINPVKYLAQVRAEGRKVVWPTLRETMVTTVMVLILMLLFGIFFFFVDWFAANGTQFFLKFGSDTASGRGG